MKEKKKTKLATIPQYTQDQVEVALKNNGGHLSFAAAELACPVDFLKTFIKKSKYLRSVVLDVREAAVDLAEDTLLWRIREKKDAISTMFLLKCLGKSRGWVEKPDKAGVSADKPIFIRILPVAGITESDGPKQVGRPKKQFAEIKVNAIANTSEIIDDAEILD